MTEEAHMEDSLDNSDFLCVSYMSPVSVYVFERKFAIPVALIAALSVASSDYVRKQAFVHICNLASFR